MNRKVEEQMNVVCRQARRQFAALRQVDADPPHMSVTERVAVERHLQICSRCARKYRLFTLQRAVLDSAASQEPLIPDEHFFKALRARIGRGPELSPSRSTEESWTAAVLLIARQLIPAMAVLLLIIVGVTMLWNQPPPETSQAALRPRERVVFSDIYDYPAPTRDDVLETLVAVEEK